MNRQEFGKELKAFLAKENDIVKISRWVFRIYSNNFRNFDYSMIAILQCLFSMEDDPQFEYTQDELNLLAEKLINNEEDALEQINEMKKKPRICISSDSSQGNLVAEIFFYEIQWAKVKQESNKFEIEFFPHPDGFPWRLDFFNVINALNEAKERLLQT